MNPEDAVKLIHQFKDIRFRVEKLLFFLKQPVAKASVNSDALTLRVPANGAVRQAASRFNFNDLPQPQVIKRIYMQSPRR